jgi:hypothetical protein
MISVDGAKGRLKTKPARLRTTGLASRSTSVANSPTRGRLESLDSRPFAGMTLQISGIRRESDELETALDRRQL